MTALLPGVLLFWFGVVYELLMVSYSFETIYKDASIAHLWTTITSVHDSFMWYVLSSHTQTINA